MQDYEDITENRCVGRRAVGRYRQSGRTVSKAKLIGHQDSLTRDNIGRASKSVQDSGAPDIAGHPTAMQTRGARAGVTIRDY